jgi:Protein of unknown function (DUF3575)
MRRACSFAALLGWLLCLSVGVRAEDEPLPEPPDPEADGPSQVFYAEPPPEYFDEAPNFVDDQAPPPTSYVTLTLSPIHLLIPMFEAQAEVRILPMLSVAAIGGFGRVSVENTDGDKMKFDAYEVGGQVVYYPSDDFRAWQLGVEAIYMHMNIEEVIGNERVSGLGAGFAAGPLLGYKWISEPGFTLFLQGGFTVMLDKAEAKNDLGQRATLKENDLFPLLNANLGWSF